MVKDSLIIAEKQIDGWYVRLTGSSSETPTALEIYKEGPPEDPAHETITRDDTVYTLYHTQGGDSASTLNDLFDALNESNDPELLKHNSTQEFLHHRR